MGMSNSDVLRKCWWNLSLNATTIFRILYGTQDYVPYEELVKHLYSDDLEKILGWMGRSIREAGGDTCSYYKFIEWDSDGYRLRDCMRAVVGELLGRHDKGKTILLESLWNMAGIVKSLETRVDDIPGDISADLAMEFKLCQQELERLSQELLKPSDA